MYFPSRETESDLSALMSGTPKSLRKRRRLGDAAGLNEVCS